MSVAASPVTQESVLLSEQANGVLTLTLNRPHALNSFTSEMLGALGDAIKTAATDDSVRVLVITGGGRAFCAGQDLAGGDTAVEMGDMDVAEHLRKYYEPVICGIREIEKPVIAAVNGVAAGAGLSLALAADMRIAAEGATFVQAFVRIGLVPDAGSTYFMPRLVGWGRAAELMMLGETIDSATALRMGLINRVAPDQQLAEATAEFAGRLAKGPRSIGLIKRALSASYDASLEQQLKAEATAQAEAMRSDDFAEGIGAFVSKRAASFTGR